MGSFRTSWSAVDSEKPSDASHRWRRTRAMASTKVGDGLSHQAAARWAIGRSCCRTWAAKVFQEKRPSRTGVVRAMARSDHWRWAVHAQMGSNFLEGCLQLPPQHKPLQDLGRACRWVGAEQGLGVEGALGIADQHPAHGDGRFARAVPDGGLGGEFHAAGGAVIPGHRDVVPCNVVLIEE